MYLNSFIYVHVSLLSCRPRNTRADENTQMFSAWRVRHRGDSGTQEAKLEPSEQMEQETSILEVGKINRTL